MVTFFGRWIVPAGWLALALSSTLDAEVLSVRGDARANVVELAGSIPIQTDVNQEIVPLTRSAPPATARARVDRFRDDGSISAAGQALTIFDQSNDGGVATSANDVGLDMGAFSDDAISSWSVDGAVTEVRTLQLTASEIGPALGRSGLAKVRSRLLLSGVMLITAEKPGQDLSGTKVSLSLSVKLHQEGRPNATLMEGQVDLIGGPGGVAQVQNTGGALAGAIMPVVDFAGQVKELPVVQTLPFLGMELPFDYQINVGQPFELELYVGAKVFTSPQGTGAAAVFGAPQDGLGAVLSRVKGDDRGKKLADVISRHVDTTGRAYVNTSATAPPISTCGAASPALLGLMVGFFATAVVRRRGSRKMRRTTERLERQWEEDLPTSAWGGGAID